MFKRTVSLLKLFLALLILFIIQKFLFIAFHYSIYSDLDINILAKIIKSGLPLDISISSYLVSIPLLLAIISIFYRSRKISYILKAYILLISILISTIFIIDLQLYSYWGFRLDTTPIFYFLSSPKSALASLSLSEFIIGLIGIPLLIGITYWILNKATTSNTSWTTPNTARFKEFGVLLLGAGLCFLGIRGGWTVSTMNLSRAYFSTNETFNHAAINPIFSLMESSLKEQNFSKQFQYFKEDKCSQLLEDLYLRKNKEKDIKPLLNQNRPNVFLIILESFSIPLMNEKHNGNMVTPYLNSLAKEGILFSNFYANSFRTDRGLVSILSGYPAQPNTSIMKYPRKAQSLPSIPASLKENSYDLYYYYGGDINFTNQKAYLKSAGYDFILSDSDFPITQKLSKWGVHDHFVFQKVIETLPKDKNTPFLCTIQTSSSHEPFEVPYEKFTNKKLNAFAYTDNCIKEFVQALKSNGVWDNSLIILVPDHQGAYPENLDNASTTRYHIPLIWTGGAIIESLQIETIGSQIDLASTLLEQLEIDSSKFTFSKNMLDKNAPHFAYFAFPNFSGLWNDETGTVLNLQNNSSMPIGQGNQEPSLSQLKALLQTLYLDLDKR